MALWIQISWIMRHTDTTIRVFIINPIIFLEFLIISSICILSILAVTIIDLATLFEDVIFIG